MSKDKTVSFTAQEYVWIAHRVNQAKKGAEAMAAGTAIGKKKDEKILEHKDYKMICKLCPVFPEMVVIKGIPVTSLCEHHLLPFTGVAHVGYIPGHKKRVIGLSKIPRLIAFYATRPQIQERLTGQIADALEKLLEPIGLAVWISTEHQCMSCRGVKIKGTTTDTTVLRGAIKELPEARAEFFNLVRQS